VTNDRPEPPEVPDDVTVPLAGSELEDLLRASGVAETAIAQAREHHHLGLFVTERFVVPHEAKYDLGEVSGFSSMSAAQIARLWRSLGFAEPSAGDRVFTEVDADMLKTVGQLLKLGWIDDDLTAQMARVVGSSMSRVATTLVDSIAPDGPQTVPRSYDGDESASIAPQLLPMLLQVMDVVWRRHVQVEARARLVREHTEGDPTHRAVGFADLVGFTALSQQIDAHELAAVVDRFESIAYETVTRLGGRVVKMIGDEVMFAVPDEASAVEVALSLAETYRDDDELSDVRIGLASGPALQREADLFGPVVNRASRLVNIAFPGSVVVSEEIVEALGETDTVAIKSIGNRNLKDIGKVPLYVLRRASEEEQTPSSLIKQQRRRAERREAKVAELEAKRRRKDKDKDKDKS